MFLLILLFVVVPIAELWAIIQVGQAIGVLPTILLLIIDSILGSLLVRSQGRRAWTRLTQTISEGRVPTNEVADGAMILFGGALMLAPGFLTDILGALLLLPPTRALLRPLLLRRVTIAGPAVAFGSRAAGAGARRGTRPPDYDVEGTVADDDHTPAGPGALPR
jgi:UPF0716 protein FxsA